MKVDKKMPARQVGVFRRSGSKSYYCRVYIPKHLQDCYHGKSSFVRSLGVHDLAEANRRAMAIRMELDAEFEELDRQLKSVTLEDLSPEQIQAIAKDEYAKALALDEQKRIAGLEPEQVKFRQSATEIINRRTQQVLARGPSEVNLDEADLLLALRGFRVDPASDSRKKLAFEMAKVKRAVEAARAARDNGEWVDTPNRIERPVDLPEEAKTTTTGGRSLEDLLDAYNLERKLSAQSLQDYRHKIRAFTELNGVLPIEQYTKEHALAFKNHLLQQGRPAKTINTKYLAFVGTVFRYAHANGFIPVNPMDGVRVMSRDEAPAPERAFTLDDLRTIFASPTFTAGERPKKWGRSKPLGESVFWIPLLALFTGARQNELCQMDKADVQEFEPGRYFLSINMENGKKLKMGRKNVRRVPVHAELLRLGFLDYVHSLPVGSKLFPELTVDARGKTNEQFSKWFNTSLKQWGIKREGINFHSFRHTFKDICRDCGVSEDIHDALTGHRSAATVGRQYGSGQYPLAPLFEAMGRVVVKGLDLSRVKAGCLP